MTLTLILLKVDKRMFVCATYCFVATCHADYSMANAVTAPYRRADTAPGMDDVRRRFLDSAFVIIRVIVLLIARVVDIL